MSQKMRQRGVLAIIIYFLMITAIWAPIAFFTGRARGETDINNAAGNGKSLSLIETGTGSSITGPAERPLSLPMAVWELFADNPGYVAPPIRRGRARSGPLRDAVLRTLADGGANAGMGGSHAGDGNSSNSAPINLAMAPSLPSATGGQAGSFGSGFGASGISGFGAGPGGSATSPNGYPGALIPGFLDTNAGPETPPADLVTPIPAALPLMLTGLGGLFAASRQRRKS